MLTIFFLFKLQTSVSVNQVLTCLHLHISHSDRIDYVLNSTLKNHNTTELSKVVAAVLKHRCQRLFPRASSIEARKNTTSGRWHISCLSLVVNFSFAPILSYFSIIVPPSALISRFDQVVSQM